VGVSGGAGEVEGAVWGAWGAGARSQWLTLERPAAREKALQSNLTI